MCSDERALIIQRIRTYLPLIILMLISHLTYGHYDSLRVDSLQRVINSDVHDTSKINAIKAWDDMIWQLNTELDLKLNKDIKKICEDNLAGQLQAKEELFFKKSLASAYNIIAIDHYTFGELDEAIESYTSCLGIAEAIGDEKIQSAALDNLAVIYIIKADFEKFDYYSQKAYAIHEKNGDEIGMAASLANMGYRYKDQGRVPESIDAFSRTLEIYESMADSAGMANSLNNLGMVYKDLDELEDALPFYWRALAIQIAVEDSSSTSQTYSQLGLVYQSRGDSDSALYFFHEALKIHEIRGFKQGIGTISTNIGLVYLDDSIYDTAQMWLERGFDIALELDKRSSMVDGYDYLGLLHSKLGNKEKAIELCLKGQNLADENQLLERQEKSSKLLYELFKEKGISNQALKYHEKYIWARDSLMSVANKRQLYKQEYRYEYQKKAEQDSILSAEALKFEEEKHALETEAQKQWSYFLYIILGVLAIFGVFVYNRFKVTRDQKNIIESQKSEVDLAYENLEEKNKEILDSISYAKRIQSAILPPLKVVKSYLEDSFILYKPKDIVAGDFYWLEHQDNKIIFAAADCTGHGVPGAMVSVICNNGLNRSVREDGLTDPGKILDRTREIVIQEFEKSEEEVKDGMDIALCTLDGMSLQYAGANNPLWILRNGEILETRANREPVGKYINQTAYTTHTIELQKGDCLYIFSDGYIDQFGGERGKKFKSKALKQLLVSMQNELMSKQHQILDETFEHWRGEIEQIDDVCVIGVRV